MTEDKKMIPLGVDFDGTCVDHRFPEIGADVPNAVEVMKDLIDKGFGIVLFTMRSGVYLDEAMAWFSKHKIPLMGVNRTPDQDRWTSSPKAYAKFYIDDAAIGAPLIDMDGFARPCVDWIKVLMIIEDRLAEETRELKIPRRDDAE